MAEPVLQNAASANGDRKKRLILVIDGDAGHLYYTSILLQRLEYNIHTVKTEQEALEIMEIAHPELILTELSPGGGNGAEFLRTIKRTPRTYALPVIILTSSKDPVAKDACLKEGCTAYLQKPVDPDALYAAIQKATESRPRSYIRLNTCLNVIVGEDKMDQSVINDYVTALSENGIYVSTAKPKPAGIRVPITLFLENSRIKVEGMVLYSFQRGEGPLKTPGMGIKFTSIQPGDQGLIRVFIKKELTKDLTMGQIGGTIL
jgi:two-component system cell cycle response regulator DivK